MTNGAVVLVRSIASILLLSVVWHHAHWSVALCLTLTVVAVELDQLVIRMIVSDRIREAIDDKAAQ